MNTYDENSNTFFEIINKKGYRIGKLNRYSFTVNQFILTVIRSRCIEGIVIFNFGQILDIYH